MDDNVISIYTDGSCHTHHKVGAWAAMVFLGDEKIVLMGILQNTTHNQMELMSVIKALHYLENEKITYDTIDIYSDSQYVVDIPKRKNKLISTSFLTKTGKQVHNTDLLKSLIAYLNRMAIVFHKVAAHQKANEKPNHNREVDLIVRKILREEIRNLGKV